MANASTQAQYAVGQIQCGNQNPNVTTTLSATESARRRHGDPRWHPTSGAARSTALAPPPPPSLASRPRPFWSTGAPSRNGLDLGVRLQRHGALTVGGVLSGTATLPNNISAGPHNITVIEANTTPYDSDGPRARSRDTTSTLPVRAATALPATAQDGTVVTITGDGFAPNLGASLAFTNGTDTGSATVNAAGHLTGSITVNTANEALGSNPVIVTQAGLRSDGHRGAEHLGDRVAAPDHQHAGQPRLRTGRHAERLDGQRWATPS